MKTRFILPVALALLAVPAANAQWRTTFGARVGMELTSPSGAGDTYKLGAGLNAGVIAKMPMMQNFYFEPGIYFVYSAMSSKNLVSFNDDYYYQGAANLYTLRVPFNFGYTFNLTNALDLSLSTGPWLNVNLSAQQKLQPNFSAPVPVPNKKINLFDNGWNRVDAQWGFNLHFTFAQNYTVGLSGGVGIAPLAKYGNKDRKVKIMRNSVALTLGYNF